MQVLYTILFIVYSIASYKAINYVVYRNVVQVGSFVEIVIKRWLFGVTFGIILIPIAIIKYLLSSR